MQRSLVSHRRASVGPRLLGQGHYDRLGTLWSSCTLVLDPFPTMRPGGALLSLVPQGWSSRNVLGLHPHGQLCKSLLSLAVRS